MKLENKTSYYKIQALSVATFMILQGHLTVYNVLIRFVDYLKNIFFLNSNSLLNEWHELNDIKENVDSIKFFQLPLFLSVFDSFYYQNWFFKQEF